MLRIALITLLLVASTSRAAEYQWSATITSTTSPETNDHPRAFLWIPPACKYVRGVIVGQNNMIEQGILDHPALRNALAEIDFAAVWVTPAFDPQFNFQKGAGEHFDNMMNALAEESGYSELRVAPVVPIGHSAMASYPYHFGAWNPQRTAAAISIKGTWPDFRSKESPEWKDSDLNGVPLLFINGEYEDAEGRAGKALSYRNRNPQVPLTMLADAGGGHFDYHDRVVDFIGLYLRKLAKYRVPPAPAIPDEGPVRLIPVDSTKTGWRYDRWRRNAASTADPAPIDQFKGKHDEAFWAWDEELARAIVAYNDQSWTKKPQLVGFLQDGKIVTQNPKAHAQVLLKFLPIEDGLTFKLQPSFLDTVPEGRPEGWTQQSKETAIGHSKSGEPITINRIIGPFRQTAPDTFQIRFDRQGLNNSKRSNDLWFYAAHPGDVQYKRAVQQAQMRIPLVNKEGDDQVITLDPISDQNAQVAPLQLKGTSSGNVPVYYYVREGPAEVDDLGNVTFSRIPPRAKFPVKVTIVAWQWGRSIEPKLKSAAPVERTFRITQSIRLE